MKMKTMNELKVCSFNNLKLHFILSGSEDEQDSVQSDDEDINRAALTGRRGQLRIVKCKGGQPCRSQTSSNSYPSLPAYSIGGDVGSGDDE